MASDARESSGRAAEAILPGAMIGVLGSGQLGRMFAIAARELGYRVAVFSPETDTPAGQIGDVEFACDYGDLAKIREFAGMVRVVTFEFENVPSATTRAAAGRSLIARASRCADPRHARRPPVLSILADRDCGPR